MFETLRRAPLVTDRSPRAWLIASTVLGLAGGALAIVQASETDLTSVSVSHLGVDAGASGIVNATLIALGASVLALGLSFKRAFATLRSASRLSRRADGVLVAGFVVAGSAVILIGVFRIDFQPSTTIHNLAAFAAPITLMATILGARVAIRDLGLRFDAWSAAIVGSIAAAFMAASRGYLPYSVMEVICFGSIGVWLWLFESRLRGLVDRL